MNISTETNKQRYAYEHLEEGLNEWSNLMNDPEVSRAVRKLKFMVLSYAWVDFCIWQKQNDKQQTLSWAWEDLALAFSGYGQSSMTGVIIDFWNATPKDKWEELRRHLNASIAKAETMTSNAVPRRYLQKYRNLASRSPKDGFDLPAIVPAWGSRLKEWASKMGMDPDSTAEQMRTIEEYERLGLIELSGELRVANASDPEGKILPAPERIAVEEPSPPSNVVPFGKGRRK